MSPFVNAGYSLSEIIDAADKICLNINEFERSSKTTGAKAKLKASLNLIFTKIGTEVEGGLHSEEVKGLTADMIKIMEEGHFRINECELKVLDKLEPRLSENSNDYISRQALL